MREILVAYSKLPPIRVHLFNYIFSPGWIPTVVTLLALPLLISLGFWQLHRAAEKKLIEIALESNNQPLTLRRTEQIKSSDLRYRKIAVSGYFDDTHSIYLDNKIHNHVPGIEVVTPFITSEKKQVLVNRGFLPFLNRTKIPSIKPLSGMKTISGFIQYPSKNIVLKNEVVATPSWPWLVQNLDIKQVENKLQTSLYPFVVMQQNHDELALIRDWHPVNFPSSRHIGYAIQWFLLALTLLALYIRFNTRKDHDRNK